MQAMGRIGGLRAKDGYPPHINFLVAKDTVDERVAWLLKNRLEQTDAMYELDDSSKQLQGLLDVGSIEESLNELFLDEELLNLGEMFDE